MPTESRHCESSVAPADRNGWITRGRLLPAAMRLGVPMVSAAVLQNMYSIVDMIFVGRLGAAAIAAVTLGGTVMGVLHILGIGIVTGSNTLISQAVGGQRREQAETAAGQAVLMGLGLSVLAAMVAPLSGWLLEILRAGPAVIDAGRPYLQITLAGTITMAMTAVFSVALRAAGDAVSPLKLAVLGNVLNIALDPLLIFGLPGVFPGLGVAGSAWATVISRGASAVLLARLFFAGRHDQFHLRLSHLRPHGMMIWRMMKIGVFSSGQMLLRNISAIALVTVVAGFGTVAVAAYGIGLRLWMVLLMMGFGCGDAAATLVGQSLGADNPRRATQAAWLMVILLSGLFLVIGAALCLFAPTVVWLFNGNPEIVSDGARLLFWLSATLLPTAVSIVLSRSLSAAGDTFTSMVIVAAAMLLGRIPLSILLSWWTGDVGGVWAGFGLSNILQGILFAAAFLWGRWKTVGRRHVQSLAEPF